MSDKSIDLTPNFYSEDVATTAPGTVLLGHPAIVWSLSAMLEGTGTAVVSFSDDATGYNPAHRIDKTCFAGPDRENMGYGKGLTCTRGLSCISNLAGVDISGIYE